MSMLSSKCDRLRETATRVEIFLEGCTDAIPMDTHEQLRSAANIIWELRNKLAGMVDQQDEIERLESENARLRELLEAILQCVGETKRDKGCDACPMFNGDEAGVYFNKNWCLLRPTMRELGIEVKP